MVSWPGQFVGKRRNLQPQRYRWRFGILKIFFLQIVELFEKKIVGILSP